MSIIDNLEDKKTGIQCKNLGCTSIAVVQCTTHHNSAFCDSCCIVLHSRCNTLPIVDKNTLLNRTQILVKLIDHIKHDTELFNINQYYTDHLSELNMINSKVSDFEIVVNKEVSCDNFTEYPSLMAEAMNIKMFIDDSMLYK